MALTRVSIEQLGNGLAAIEDLDPYAERVLTAAADEFYAHGLRRTSLERIAEAAGVSHMTLYRRFSNRDALLGAVVARELRRFLARFDAKIATAQSHEERFILGVVTAACELTGDTLVRRLLTTDRDAVLALLTSEAETFLVLSRAYIASALRQVQDGGMPISGDVDMLAEVFVRIAHSLLLSPVSVLVEDEERVRNFARQSLLPMLYGG
jgi:TetR/AcrR family transcriptional regulator, repressor for uid operon